MQTEGGDEWVWGGREGICDNRADNAGRGTFKIRFPRGMVEKLFSHLHVHLEENFKKDLKSKCDSVALNVDHLTPYPSVPPVFVPFPNIRAGTSDRKSD